MKKLLQILLLLVCIATAQSSVFAQTSWRTYRDTETEFRFLHPPDWYFGKPRGPNVKATLFPPTDKPRANCNIVVQNLRETANTSQQDLNTEISSTTLTAEDWKQMMGQKWPDFRLIESRHVKVDNQPAFYAVVEHSHQTVDRKTYIKGAVLATLTPGHTWIFSCAGKGDTRSEADDSFQYWKPTFDRILGSLVFESRFDPANVEIPATSGSFIQLGAYLVATAAFCVLGLVVFCASIRRINPAMPKLGNKFVLVIIAGTVVLHFISQQAASLASGICILLALISIPIWIIGLFMRPPRRRDSTDEIVNTTAGNDARRKEIETMTDLIEKKKAFPTWLRVVLGIICLLALMLTNGLPRTFLDSGSQQAAQIVTVIRIAAIVGFFFAIGPILKKPLFGTGKKKDKN